MHVGMNWKLKFLAGALSLGALTAIAVPAQAQITITIGSAPPPVRYEQRPPQPRDGYAWRDGYWGVDRGRYVWVPGRWDRLPYQGAYWVPPRYEQVNNGWRMQQGHWNRADNRDRSNNDDRGNHDDNRGNHDNGNHYGRDKDKNGKGHDKDKHDEGHDN